jgi:hypothetical protein
MHKPGRRMILCPGMYVEEWRLDEPPAKCCNAQNCADSPQRILFTLSPSILGDRIPLSTRRRIVYLYD